MQQTRPAAPDFGYIVTIGPGQVVKGIDFGNTFNGPLRPTTAGVPTSPNPLFVTPTTVIPPVSPVPLSNFGLPGVERRFGSGGDVKPEGPDKKSFIAKLPPAPLEATLRRAVSG